MQGSACRLCSPYLAAGLIRLSPCLQHLTRGRHPTTWQGLRAWLIPRHLSLAAR
jgi:hypothetical protein